MGTLPAVFFVEGSLILVQVYLCRQLFPKGYHGSANNFFVFSNFRPKICGDCGASSLGVDCLDMRLRDVVRTGLDLCQ